MILYHKRIGMLYAVLCDYAREFSKSVICAFCIVRLSSCTIIIIIIIAVDAPREQKEISRAHVLILSLLAL